MKTMSGLHDGTKQIGFFVQGSSTTLADDFRNVSDPSIVRVGTNGTPIIPPKKRH